jgi:hypothetical protein
VREAGFHDGQVLKIIHLPAEDEADADADADADGSKSHVMCHGSRIDPDSCQQVQTMSLRVPTAPSYAVANILFQLQGNARRQLRWSLCA